MKSRMPCSEWINVLAAVALVVATVSPGRSVPCTPSAAYPGCPDRDKSGAEQEGGFARAVVHSV
jgi:hypothetical protein